MKTLPLSPTRRLGDLLFLSGEVPADSDDAVPADVGAQVDLVLDRIEETLRAEGLTLSDVLSATVYLSSPDHFEAYNAVWTRRFSAPYPCRTTVQAPLMMKADVEVTVVAGFSPR